MELNNGAKSDNIEKKIDKVIQAEEEIYKRNKVDTLAFWF